ncbi:MAG: Mov34/MPN/PAD-1 family protein [Planctomycetota bacterium]
MRYDDSSLILPRRLAEKLGGWIEQGYPHETCGLLIGRTAGCEVVVQSVVQARNLDRERARDRYELAPDDWIAADLDARARGSEIVGIWHSHPDQPAAPSATDLERAWRGYSYLIASVTREGVQGLSSWRLRRESFVKETIEELVSHENGHDSLPGPAAQPDGRQLGPCVRRHDPQRHRQALRIRTGPMSTTPSESTPGRPLIR